MLVSHWRWFSAFRCGLVRRWLWVGLLGRVLWQVWVSVLDRVVVAYWFWFAVLNHWITGLSRAALVRPARRPSHSAFFGRNERGRRFSPGFQDDHWIE